MRQLYELTTQERRVLHLLGQGRRNAKIADEMLISIRTVENHLYHIFDKLGFSSRTEAALYAFNMGLVANSEMSESSESGKSQSEYLENTV